MYFESHAHYDDKRFQKDREKLLGLLPERGIDYVINSASDMASSLFGIRLAEKYDYIYASVGVHPHETEHMKEEDIEILRGLCAHEKVVAIGEIGLDYYYEHSPKETQRYWFSKQLSLAKELDMPVIIHSRDAAQECFDMIHKSGVRKGVIHCYSGSLQMALDYIEMGFFIGIGGVVTFSNAKKLVEVAKEIPMEKMLIETDSPYLSPVPKRGERNDSRNLQYVVEMIANLRNISVLEVANITKENAIKLFLK